MSEQIEALSTLNSFIRLFNEGKNPDAIVELFAPDAQFWGTTLPDFGTETDIIRDYFASAFTRRAGASVTASITGTDIQAIAPGVVTMLGHWQIERQESTNRLRFSLVLHKRDDRWLIGQFHSSQRPSD